MLLRLVHHALQHLLSFGSLHWRKFCKMVLHRRVRGIGKDFEGSLIQCVIRGGLGAVVCGCCERQHNIFGKLAVEGDHGTPADE
jgi:hypothetical protein